MYTQQQLTTFYHDKADELKARIKSLRAKSHAFVVGEIGSFVAILFFIALITLGGSTAIKIAEGVLAVLMAAVYVVIRNRDVKNSELIAQFTRLMKAYQHEEKYLSGDFSAFDNGARYVDPHHPFTFDLDVFGNESLYQRINRTVTTGGADKLAEDLSKLTASPLDNDNMDANEADSDKEEAWRLQFISEGIDEKIDTGAILKTLPQLKKISIPKYYGGIVMKVVAWLLCLGFIASIIAAVYGLVSAMLPIVWLFFNFFFVAGITGKRLKQMLKVCATLKGQMQPLMRLVSLAVDNKNLKVNNELKEAQASFELLTDIVETLILRGSDAYKFFADSLALRGIFLVCKFWHWRQMSSDKLPEWIDDMAELDVIVSKKQFAYNHPEATVAEIVDDSTVVYEAKGLYHPFLGAHAVKNDFTIDDRNFYIITGANMAGKSTFLRAVGVNYILAMNGMPVFADSLKVSRFNLFTSMRTSDDLAHGISYFNAELLRLKQLMQSVGSPTLIILDEILKGTNSEDKLNGSRIFLRAIAEKNVSGIIATHDLELSKMEQESSRFHNYCFEIDLGTDVTYTYKITKGVARNQNATFLLKKMLYGQ